jgi:hypothetical protein
MAIFNSYVSLPEGKVKVTLARNRDDPLQARNLQNLRSNKKFTCPVVCAENEQYCFIPSYDAKGNWISTAVSPGGSRWSRLFP